MEQIQNYREFVKAKIKMAEADRNVPSLFDELEDEEIKGAV